MTEGGGIGATRCIGNLAVLAELEKGGEFRCCGRFFGQGWDGLLSILDMMWCAWDLYSDRDECINYRNRCICK